MNLIVGLGNRCVWNNNRYLNKKKRQHDSRQTDKDCAKHLHALYFTSSSISFLNFDGFYIKPFFSFSSPITSSLVQTPSGGWLCWTRLVRRSLGVRRQCVAASPTLSTRRPSSSRWRCSNFQTSRCSSPSIAAAAWSAKRWWAGSRWAKTAAVRRSSSTGRTWRRVEDSRSAAGTSC